jgi:hypothetical protein
MSSEFMRAVWRAASAGILVLAFGMPLHAAQSDTEESAYAPATLAKVFGGTARSQNDEAELAAPGEWFTTTATFTGRKRPPSGRNRPIVGAWLSSRGEDGSSLDMYFSGDLPELEFEQGGRKYWVLAGLPAGWASTSIHPARS